MNEYYFFYYDGGEEKKLSIYHCMFCGGAAPDSFRPSKFSVLSEGEIVRLRELTKDLTTVDRVLAALGRPDSDEAQGVMRITPESDERGEITESFRALVYRNLSQTAEIWVAVGPGGETHFSFSGKYLGESEDA